MTETEVAHALLARHPTTYAEDAGILLADDPDPWWRLLVLSLLLSARIRSEVAVAAARELFEAGCSTARGTRAAPRRERVRALGRAGYRRYDERTATQLGDLARTVRDEYGDDLRRLPHATAAELARALQRFGGIGPVGASIFIREAQSVWPALAPYVDERAREGARRLGLPDSPAALAALVDPRDLPRLVAACVRAARDRRLATDVLAANALAGRPD